MAACRLLQCPELLAEIFSHLELAANLNDVDGTHTAKIDLRNQELRKTLAAAALSCRALAEHALPILWRRLDSVLPLLSLLSKPRRRHPKTNLTMLQADITQQSWLRFQIHARRVRVLHAPDWSGIHPSTWAFVGRWCGTAPLLPNLEELSVLPLGIQNPTTMMFISPKLRSLSLALRFDELEVGCGWIRQGDTDVVNILFRQIMSIAPGIRTLSIQSNVSCLPPTSLYRISDLKDLSTLHARDCVLDFAFLRWLGGRPSLRTLSATIDMAELPPRPQDPEDEDYYDYSPFYGYDHLEHLHVRGSPNDIHLFLDTAVPCSLKTHTVEFDACAAPAAITRCIETIWDNDRTRRSVLRSLTLIYPDEYYTDEDAGNTLQHASLVDVIRPALAIRGLRRVTLTFHEIPSLSDAGILEMVVAWPKLTALHITPATATEGLGRYRAGTKLSPALLVALARQCPRLAELTLPEIELGDGREMEKNMDMPVVGQRAMRRLRLVFCHWAAHEDVRYTAAVFLDRLFPCLDLHPSFEGEDGEDEADERSGWSWDERGRKAETAWRRIEEYLYAMQLGRRHSAVLQGAASL